MENDFIAHYLGPDNKSQSVLKHLEEVSKFASIFASKIGLPLVGELVGLLHDFGKYSKYFQNYIRSAEGMLDPDEEPIDAKKLKGKIDHSTAGAQLVWDALKERDGLSRLVAQVVSLCVASHHSGLLDCLSPDGEDKFSGRMAKKDGQTHLNEARRVAGKVVLDKVFNLLDSSSCGIELKNQLERLFDGEKSQEIREFYLGFLARSLFSTLIDADRLSAAGHVGHGVNAPRWELLVERLERYISGIEQRSWVDEVRTEVSLACRKFALRQKGLFQLTVPTGGGKTLSSLRFGVHHAAQHRMDRLIYVIPYTSIIDQNAAVARTILEGDIGKDAVPIVLEHHSNLTPEKETWNTRLLSENWDAPVIFTTTVQFLETLFAGGTRGVRRLHQLANAVIIFDEIQTLPIKTVHLFNNAINFLVKQCGSSVVNCTATQPLLHAVCSKKGAARLTGDLKESEMAPRRDELFSVLRRAEVLDCRKDGGWTEREIAQCACDEVKDSGSALVIVNTKAAAQALYDLCRQEVRTVFHLSTNMCPVHRMTILEKIKYLLSSEKQEPVVCVSTQLIEAGVDIDFGAVVRYLAGLDSIAQAAGRCNRNGRRPSGRVVIVNPRHESLDRLPDIKVGKQVAERVLDEYRHTPGEFDNDLLSPKTMQRYYEYYFFNRAHEMAYPVSSRAIGHDDDLLTMLSTNARAVAAYARENRAAPALSLRQSFKSAGRAFKVINAPTEGIIVPYGEEGRRIIAELCAAAHIEKTKQLLREAQRYSVNLYPYDMKKLTDMECIHETHKGSGILYLDPEYYSGDMGVVYERKQLMDCLLA